MIVWVEQLHLEKPCKEGGAFSSENALYPVECRERGISYSGPLYASVSRKIDNEQIQTFKVKLGDLPIMVKSNYCHLHDLTPEDLVAKREDLTNFGGYFIINGNERLVRMLI